MSKPFDLLKLLAEFSRAHNRSLADSKTAAAFLHNTKNDIARALDDPTLLHGSRTESMFESLVVSLGQFKFLKHEDEGRIFPEGKFVAPDFRVVTTDDVRWLIEVKNVYEPDPFNQRRRLFHRSYLNKLLSYCDITGCSLKIAVYWARWSIWTLISPDLLSSEEANLYIEMESAMKANEMAALGDRTIATRSPLRLRFILDPCNSSVVDRYGSATGTIREIKFYCGDDEVTNRLERELIWIFIQYGEWQEEAHEAILDGDRLVAIDCRWNPIESSRQGFDIVGSFSRMFARYYAQQTMSESTVVQLHAPVRANWFAQYRNLAGNTEVLPLWEFIQKPE